MKNITYVLYVLIMCGLMSCSDNIPSDPLIKGQITSGDNILSAENSDHLEYYKQYFQPAYGSISISSDLGNALRPHLNESNTSRYSLLANFTDIDKLKEFPIYIGDYEVEYDEDYKSYQFIRYPNWIEDQSPQIETLFGKNITIRVPGLDKINLRTDSSDFDIYMPEPIELTNLNLNENPLNRIQIHNRTLELNWVPDVNNENGMVAIVSCLSPILGTNCKVRNVKSIEDDGSFTLSSEMFQDIPDSTLISISLYRMTIDLNDLIEEDDPLKIVAYSKVGDDALLVD